MMTQYKSPEAYFDGYSVNGYEGVGYAPPIGVSCPVTTADVIQVWDTFGCGTFPGDRGTVCTDFGPGTFVLEQFCDIGGPEVFVGFWVVDEVAKTIQFTLNSPFTPGPLIPLSTPQVSACEDMLGGFCV